MKRRAKKWLAASLFLSFTLFPAFCASGSPQAASGQTGKALHAHDYGINLSVQDKAKRIVYTLAGKELKGRKFATEEGKTAAFFIKEELDEAFHGVPRSSVFFQHFCLDTNKDDKPACGRNVLAVIYGQTKRSEYVFVTAHYDHVGEEGGIIFPGADDNASGTSAVIAVAGAFAALAKKGIRPERNIVFAFFDGEEEGLWGSEYFVKHSVVSLEEIVAVINVDMVGRNDAHELYLVATLAVLDAPEKNPDMYQISIKAGEEVGLKLLLSEKRREDDTFERSDHASFFFASSPNRRIPVIHVDDGDHPDYHRPTDTADKIDYGKIERVTRFVFLVALETANRPERPVYKGKW
ncbi:MAG: M20/M25/M40 family metallo-hydrolase [Candidatus Liptonbacteria bacterium]|nr:M20/M25/M40 family metallo-hydrolase [Candidatus Liptonbacteria bacterium]